MKFFAYLCLFAYAVYVSSLFVSRMQDSRFNECRTQLASWVETSGEWEAATGQYADAMNDASFVIGQHITLLDAFRKEQVEIGVGKWAMFEKKYRYNMDNLERVTPDLKKKYENARETQKKIKIPFFMSPLWYGK